MDAKMRICSREGLMRAYLEVIGVIRPEPTEGFFTAAETRGNFLTVAGWGLTFYL